MAVEDELFEEVAQVFGRLVQMVQQFQGLSRRRQERMLREAISDWLKSDPQANAMRQQIDLPDQTFEQRVAAEVNRILDERFGAENAAEHNRDPQHVEAQQAEQGEQVETPEAEAQEAELAEVGQQGPVFEQTDDGQVVSPAVIGGDTPPLAAEQDDNPIYTQLMNEQAAQRAQQLQAAGTPIFDRLVAEQQGPKRPEGERLASRTADCRLLQERFSVRPGLPRPLPIPGRITSLPRRTAPVERTSRRSPGHCRPGSPR
jgi:hypothetical protein